MHERRRIIFEAFVAPLLCSADILDNLSLEKQRDAVRKECIAYCTSIGMCAGEFHCFYLFLSSISILVSYLFGGRYAHGRCLRSQPQNLLGNKSCRK